MQRNMIPSEAVHSNEHRRGSFHPFSLKPGVLTFPLSAVLSPLSSWLIFPHHGQALSVESMNIRTKEHQKHTHKDMTNYIHLHNCTMAWGIFLSQNNLKVTVIEILPSMICIQAMKFLLKFKSYMVVTWSY